MNAIGINAIGIALVWCMLQVTLACSAGAAVYLVARKMGWAAGRMTTIASLAMVLVLSVAALSPWPSWLVSGPGENDMAAAVGNKAASQIALQNRDQSSAGTDSVKAERAAQPEPSGPLNMTFWQSVWAEMQRTPATADKTIASASSAWRWPAVVACVFFVTAVIELLRLFIGWLALRRLDKRSTTLGDSRLAQLVVTINHDLSLSRPIVLKPVVLKESPKLQTAATFGWRRPVILLPAAWCDWPAEELRAVLAHELAHIRTGDFLPWLFAQLAVAVHFYHPLVHWLAGRLRLEQELAADATAARLAGGRETYLHSLAALTLRADNFRPRWAAQTFLPTRSTFLRRIEMLKQTKPMTQENLSGKTRFAVIGVLMAIGLLAGGLRAPGPISATQLVAAEPGSEDTDLVQETKFAPRSAMKPADRAAFDAKADMGYIPEGAFHAIRVRPAEIFNGKAMQAAAEEVSRWLAEWPGGDVFQVEEFDTILITTYVTVRGTSGTQVMFRTVEPVSQAKADRFLQTGWGMATVDTVHVDYPKEPSYFYRKRIPEGPAYRRIGDRTFVFDTSAASLKRCLDRLESGYTPPVWLGNKQPDAKTQLWLAFNAETIFMPTTQGDRSTLVGGFPLQMISPLFRDMQRVVASVQITPVIRVAADAVCPSREAAGHVEETTSAMLVMLRNIIAEQRHAAVPARTRAAALAPTLRLIQPLLDSVQVKASGNRVLLATFAQLQASEVFQTLFPAIRKARKSAKQAQSHNNLRQIAIALQKYAIAHGSFPPAVLYDKKSGTPYSWRVAILPFIEQRALYDQYHFDELWDSEHNMEIAKTVVVPTFTSSAEPTSTNAAYFALVGPETVFAGKEGVNFVQIRDGSTNTILVVEAKRDIPWTKPEDIPYSPDKPLPKLDGFFEGVFIAAFCDGSVHFLPDDINPQTLRHLIEKADRNVVDRSEFQK